MTAEDFEIARLRRSKDAATGIPKLKREIELLTIALNAIAKCPAGTQHRKIAIDALNEVNQLQACSTS